MAYTLPDFNLVGDWWDAGNAPALNPPDVTDIACQLYRFSRETSTSGNALIRLPVIMAGILAFPPDSATPPRPIMEIPQGSGNFYRVALGVFMHRGFVNEYIQAFAVPCRDDGTSLSSDTTLQ